MSPSVNKINGQNVLRCATYIHEEDPDISFIKLENIQRRSFFTIEIQIGSFLQA